jgi:hypothetical protein
MSDPTQPPPYNLPKPQPVNQAGASLAKSIQTIRDNFLMTMEVHEVQARAIRSKYENAIAQGFTEAQAMFLCTQEWKF